MASNLTNKESKLQSVKEENKTTPAKKRGRPPKKAPTTLELIHKEQTFLTLPDSGIELVYIPPGIQQHGIIMTFMLNAMRPLVMDNQEASGYKKEELANKMFNKFNELMSDADEKRKASIIAMMLLDAEHRYLLYEMISECFPGVDPSKLKEEIYIEMFTVFVESFNKNVLGVEE